jgi:predicted transcriptional regulator
MLSWSELASREQAVVLDIYEKGPDCAKFVARRFSMELGTAMEMLKRLEREGWLERVKGTFLSKRVFRRPKHMNHTYYDLSRKARLVVREERRKG